MYLKYRRILKKNRTARSKGIKILGSAKNATVSFPLELIHHLH